MKTYEIITKDLKIKEVLEQFVLDCNKAVTQAVIPKGLPIDKAMFTITMSQPNPDSNRFRIHFIVPPLPRPMGWMVFRNVKGQIKKYLEGNGIKNFEIKEIKEEDLNK